MPEVRAYGGGVAHCTCLKLPHDKDCPAAPYFAREDAITLDSEEDQDLGTPFYLHCPHCKEHFPQTLHATGYDYTPTHGQTDQYDLPLVCPLCSYTDKQTLPAIVGYDPASLDDDEPFTIHCPERTCGWTGDRTDGVIDIWLEKQVVMGVDKMKHKGFTFEKGDVFSEITQLSITCPECGHSYGEDSD